jgi:predicted short-subunit dehydrogenase-like oxidoreductase (DUF2520 family)
MIFWNLLGCRREGFFMLQRGGEMLKIGIVGAGTVGTALAIKLSGSGYVVSAAASRTLASAERLAAAVPGCRAVLGPQAAADASDVVFITTPDGVIGEVAAQVKWRSGQSVVHCSGADSTAVLQPARALGARVGAFHPLQTFAGVNQAVDNLPGSTFAVEAEEPLRTILKTMAEALGCYAIELDAADKVVYHASAVIACNYLVTLIKLATDLWQSFDVPRAEAVRALMPLLKGTLNNLESVGLPYCLTGPIARGDVGTVRKHLVALDAASPRIATIYRELGLETVPVSLDKGKIDGVTADMLVALLQQPVAAQAGTTTVWG